MQLVRFRVRDFRSINDSGWIDLARITALLGRNESGKSNLLLALLSLNPAGGIRALVNVKDFPRHRRLEECRGDTMVLETVWSLTPAEQAELAALFPRAKGVTRVVISRSYDGSRYVSFEELPDVVYDAKGVASQLRKIRAGVEAGADALDEVQRAAALDAFAEFERALKEQVMLPPSEWAKNAVTAFGPWRKTMAATGLELGTKPEEVLDELQDQAETLAGDAKAAGTARAWAVKRLPVFMFLEDYPSLPGKQNISDYIQRKDRGQSAAAGDVDFEKLCKVAGLDPRQLHELRGDAETRNQLMNRASSVVTQKIRQLWSDRKLTVRFGLDGEVLTTFVSDPNAVFSVEVNLDERSRGFRWFFSFYITFAADTDGGSAADAILLLDEPGLYLHARSQEDFLGHMEKDFENQIIYTTHSPFMVPVKALDTIRTVNIDGERGTTVTNDPSGDARTLFPLQAALGYDLVQTLFVGSNNLVLEGVTDYWYLSSVSEHFRGLAKTALDPAITLTPAGGAQKVPYMVALLSAQRLNVIVLLDHEKDAAATRAEIAKAQLLRDKMIVSIAAAFAVQPAEADVEDLLTPAIFEALVQESYAKELSGKVLKLNSSIPRIARRMQQAFEDLGLAFHKTRPAKLFLQKMGSDPGSVLDQDAVARFERLFTAINQRYAQLSAAPRRPFE